MAGCRSRERQTDPGDVTSILKAAGWTMIYEEGEDGWGAYSPDLPGVVSHGDTHDEAVANM